MALEPVRRVLCDREQPPREHVLQADDLHLHSVNLELIGTAKQLSDRDADRPEKNVDLDPVLVGLEEPLLGTAHNSHARRRKDVPRTFDVVRRDDEIEVLRKRPATHPAGAASGQEKLAPRLVEGAGGFLQQQLRGNLRFPERTDTPCEATQRSSGPFPPLLAQQSDHAGTERRPCQLPLHAEEPRSGRGRRPDPKAQAALPMRTPQPQADERAPRGESFRFAHDVAGPAARLVRVERSDDDRRAVGGSGMPVDEPLESSWPGRRSGGRRPAACRRAPLGRAAPASSRRAVRGNPGRARTRRRAFPARRARR